MPISRYHQKEASEVTWYKLERAELDRHSSCCSRKGGLFLLVAAAATGPAGNSKKHKTLSTPATTQSTWTEDCFRKLRPALLLTGVYVGASTFFHLTYVVCRSEGHTNASLCGGVCSHLPLGGSQGSNSGLKARWQVCYLLSYLTSSP